MIWFNIKKLEEKISNNQLSDNEGFSYLLATIILGILHTVIVSASGFSLYTIINLVVAVLITIVGLPVTYKINCGKDKVDYFKRFIAITWVVRMKLMIYTAIFFFLFINIFKLKEPSVAKEITYLVFSIFLNFLFFFMTINSFKRIKTNPK